MLFIHCVASDVSNENAYSVIGTEEDSSPHNHHSDNIKSHKTLSVSSKVIYIKCTCISTYEYTF
jgi:hypothetical protein